VTRVVTALVLLAAVAGGIGWRAAAVKPDPNVQAVPDGCERDTSKIFTGFAPNWVYVNDRGAPAAGPPPPPQLVTGVVRGASGLLASRISSSDDPITHRSFDVNIDVTVDPRYDFLTGTSRDGTPERGTLHLERERNAYPPWAQPRTGDRIEAFGSWVWDCDHYQGRGEKTELHPYRGTWIDRNPGGPSPTSSHGDAEGDLYFSTDATPAGQEAECAHTTKGSAEFKTCAHNLAAWLSINGTYDFPLCAPQPRPSGAVLVRRVVDRGSVGMTKLSLSRGKSGSCVSVRLVVDAPVGQRVVVAKQVYLGWSTGVKVEHLRLQFDRLLVRRAMDPSCPPDRPACPFADETTLLGQIAQAPGEWQLEWSVDGIWGRWPGTLAANDGSTFPGKQSVDFYVRRGQPWTFIVLARECDFGAVPSWAGQGHPLAPCPRSTEVGNEKGDDYPGAITVTYRGLALGRHVADASTKDSTCPQSNVHGCYQLSYTVRRVR
jgi:hypothetical protein